MIKISVNYIDNKINNIVIDGHSDYADYGKDIVCASVSSIVTTTINAIIRLNGNSIDYKEKDGLVSIQIIKHTKELDILIDNMLDLLKELMKDYKKNIEINEEVHP